MRGCFSVRPCATGQIWVFPAHAGVFLFPDTVSSPQRSLPRSCGGVSQEEYPGLSNDMSSPLMRGCFLHGNQGPVIVRVFPAHAGVFPAREPRARHRSRLPRSCGGVSHSFTISSVISPVFPAHAGVFLGWLTTSRSIIRLPRSCGGVSITGMPTTRATGSSPLMRGCFRHYQI